MKEKGWLLKKQLGKEIMKGFWGIERCKKWRGT
jgi:hypothetical protein